MVTANNSTDLRNGVVGELGVKAPALVASLINIILEGEQTINGVAVVENDIALVPFQTDQTENGLYIVSTSAWQRAVWFNNGLDAVPGTLILTVQGTQYPNTIWQTICADNPIQFGTSLITFIPLVSGINTGDITLDPTSQNYLSLAGQVLLAAKIALANMANLAANSFIGNNTVSPAAPIALNQTQATALLNVVVGDSGSGGIKGLVPAPVTGDGASNKFLRADGTWALPSSDLPAEIIMYANNTPPLGYLECNGAAISRTTYAGLFSVIGIIFGSGDGSTTFNIPDLRGYFVRGWDHGVGIDPGRTFGSIQMDAFQGHYHNVLNASTGGQLIDSSLNASGGGAGEVASVNEHGGVNTGNFVGEDIITDGVSGTPRIAAETRPLNIALMYCIKY